MTVDEILAKEGPLTDEEFAFLEHETLKAARELDAHMQLVCDSAKKKAPWLARRLRRAAASVLENVEKAVAVGGIDGRLPD